MIGKQIVDTLAVIIVLTMCLPRCTEKCGGSYSITDPGESEQIDTKEGSMFKRIAHVSLKTRDLSTSLAYYTRLGFSVQFKFTKDGADYGAYLKIAPGNYIEIFEDKSLETVVNNGIAHFCLETESIDAVIEQLTALEIPFTPKKFGCDSSWQIWLADPDGNQFEVHQYTANSMQLKEGGSVEIDW